jgi:hypothetical protein
MNLVEQKTYWVKIYISGPLDIISQICRRECMKEGLCVTIEPTTFIYTGGQEFGVVIGLINYPRFPKEPEEIFARANNLALTLLDETFQNSVLIMSQDNTLWISRYEKQ